MLNFILGKERYITPSLQQEKQVQYKTISTRRLNKGFRSKFLEVYTDRQAIGEGLKSP